MTKVIESMDQVQVGQTLSIGAHPMEIVCTVDAILGQHPVHGLKLRIAPDKETDPEVIAEFTEPYDCRGNPLILCPVCPAPCRVYWLTPEDLECGGVWSL